jgi:DNA-directed RNA polymerase sigma subunit (sigma70/sigma32)
MARSPRSAGASLSRERIRQIQRRAIAKMRAARDAAA